MKKKNNCEKYRKPFELCVDALLIAADKLDPYWPGGMDYKKINVLLFCVVGPALFAASVALNVVLAIKLASLMK
jgi:hypothetical protein